MLVCSGATGGQGSQHQGQGQQAAHSRGWVVGWGGVGWGEAVWSGVPKHTSHTRLPHAYTHTHAHAHKNIHTSQHTQHHVPAECIPDPEQYKQIPDVQEIIKELQVLLNPNHHEHHLRGALSSGSGAVPCPRSGGCGDGPGGGKAVLLAMGLQVGDRVLVNGVKTGILR